MPAPYSMDLRTRAFQDLQSGMRPAAVAQKYSVSLRTVFDWRTLWRTTGQLVPRRRIRPGRKRKLEIHRERILDLLDQKTDLTLQELRTQLQLPCGIQTLYEALLRWGRRFKKEHTCRGTTSPRRLAKTPVVADSDSALAGPSAGIPR